jgi:hypothetical protein
MANPTAQVQTTTTPWTGEVHKRGLAATAATYYTGEMIGLDSSGNAVKCDDAAATLFDGLVANSVPVTVESTDSAGDKKVDVQRPRWFRMKIASAAAGDEGKLVYAKYSNEVSYAPGTYGTVIGRVVQVISSTEVEVEVLAYGDKGPFADDLNFNEIKDDFNWYISPHQWTSILTDSGTTAVGDAAGGVLTITASDGTVADNDEAYVKSTNETFLFADGKPISFACRIKLTETTANEANICVGLKDAVAANSIVDDGAGPPASYSGMLIFKVDGGSVFQGESSIAGTQDTDTNVGAFTSGAWTDIRMDWTPLSSTSGRTDYYVNGVLGGSSTFTYTSATEMQVFLGVKNGNGTNNMALLVDCVKVRQKR